jgi:hypothetical protein
MYIFTCYTLTKLFQEKIGLSRDVCKKDKISVENKVVHKINFLLFT